MHHVTFMLGGHTFTHVLHIAIARKTLLWSQKLGDKTIYCKLKIEYSCMQEKICSVYV